ncbi:hypothetical protein VQ045_19900 [Aurantimonas sp. E1-2-R+4]|uniref:hypothetical protein n=1 Tax=Aurantimonas sp. E1-2-R+4 TaxID=3113714 RepID=UPI002F93262E
MYNDDVTRVPRNEDELWEVLREQFEFVRDVLYDLEVETREEALENVHHERLPNGRYARGGMNVIRYRGTCVELGQRDHYLAMGRDLLPYIEQAIDQRQYTPDFVQQWGKIMFCHGMVAAFVFDDTDDLAHDRAGWITGQKRSKDAQRKWIAHLMIPLVDKGLPRSEAEGRIFEYVDGLLSEGSFPAGFDRAWFAPITNSEWLVSTYDEKHFALKTMRGLLAEPTDDIPPIPDEIP